MSKEYISDNLREVRNNISAAAARVGRDPREITLVGVSKTVDVPTISMAVAGGLTDVGENRVQELLPKVAALEGHAVTWHFIGHLQTNKVRSLLPHIALLHSLDRWSLAKELEKRASLLQRQVSCLIEINIAGEASKEGLPPAEVEEFIRSVANDCPHVDIVGLMTVAPYLPPEDVRPYFQQMYRIFTNLKEQEGRFAMRHLSMGMSNDYVVAVEEGSTLVRVGTAIFGRREA